MQACAEPSAHDWKDIFALLDTALDLDLDAAGQARWLAALAPEQAHLAPMLARLLQARTEVDGGDFMRSPANFALAGLPDAGVDGASGPRAGEPAAQAIVGPYRLLSEIGQGGMATVWLAVRADGLLDRQVALKLPHASWGSAAHADRMARERNILASLTHPHIARLYDAGIADDGRPYLALEYVDGQPIDVYARGQGLPVRARVELVVQVARAVAHAHAQLVVHRDLKPSNILVDAAGRAHLLDFGIAKLVDPALDDDGPASALTQAQGRALTPDYASPEQIRGDAIGTASDVYSLGVVLFELLAGDRPYRLKKGLGPVALADAIAHASVPRASAVAADPAVQRQLTGDLDAIVGRALAKASTERYATIDALADDLERHLRGEPVCARPDARWYRAERWVRRHKLETAIVAAVLLAALGGAYAQLLVLLALGIGAAVALWQRNLALQQAERARVALERAEQVKGFIASIFTQAVPRAGKGGAVTAADLLQAASRRVETDLSGQPEVAAELGVLIGTSFNELGELRAGLDWLPRVVERCTRALGPTHPLTLQGRWRMVEAANTLGELAISEPLLQALVRDARNANPPVPVLLAEALRSHAFVHSKCGREAEAMAALHEAVVLTAMNGGESSDDALITRAALSNTYVHFGRLPDALQAIEPALTLARAAHGASRPHPTLVMVERCYADALARNDRPRDAVAMLRQIVADQRTLDAGETTRVRTVMATLGQSLMVGGHLDEADAVLVQAEALHRSLTTGVNDEAIHLAHSRSLCATLRGDGSAALRLVTEAREMGARLGRQDVYAAQQGSLQMLALAVSGHAEAALAAAEAFAAPGVVAAGTVIARAQRVRALALRQLGQIDAAGEAAALARQAAARADCSGLERGLVLAESARCSRAAGDLITAGRHFGAALAAWESGQVDGESLLAGVRREAEALQVEIVDDVVAR